MRNRNHAVKSLALLLLCGILLFGSWTAADGTEAREISEYCTVSSPNHDSLSKLLNEKLDQPVTFRAGEPVTVTWKEKYAPETVCLSWYELPADATLTQYDGEDQLLLSESLNVTEYDCKAAILPGTKRLVIESTEKLVIDRIALFEAGELPEPYGFEWQPTPDHLDYLLIATHPDDDILFMGVLHPILGQEQGYAGTTAYATTPSRKRINEALRGLWTDGGRIYPVFLGFEDVSQSNRKKRSYLFKTEDVTLAIVRMLRQVRPLVVFTHDKNGEYGHWQHVIVSKSVKSACELAADPTYDPESAELYGTWQVQKCYLHLWEENSFKLNMNTPLVSMNGRTALRITKSAFKKHESQQNGNHEVEGENGKYPPNRFGMAYGVVAAGDGPFDNIDETLFSFYVPPTPEPTPTPTPTPSPSPTPEPTAAPTETPTPTPLPTAEPTQQPVAVASGAHPAMPGLIGCSIIGAILLAALLIARKKNRSA